MDEPIRARFIGGPQDGHEVMIPKALEVLEFAQLINPMTAETRILQYRLQSLGKIVATYVYTEQE